MATETPAAAPRLENLALLFQEVMTVVVRLRAGRLNYGNADTFREQVKSAIGKAEREALRRGYGSEDVRVAMFMVVAFLDESVLNSHQKPFADWQRKPLQQEMFGVDNAGEIIFTNIERLLTRNESEALSDLLEVHQLCLLLGFRGKYSATGTSAEIRSLVQQMGAKILRIRGGGPAHPAWQPLMQAVAAPGDTLIPALKWTAIGMAGLALSLFAIFKFSLSSLVSDLGSLAAQIFQ